MKLILGIIVVLVILGGSAYFAAREHVRRMHPPADPARIAALKASGRILINAIEAYHRNRGRYPDNLRALGKAAELALVEKWTYRRSEDGKGYGLWVGDYEKDRFVLDWQSEYGDWTTDQ